MKKGVDHIGVTASYLAHDGEGNFRSIEDIHEEIYKTIQKIV